MRRSSVSIAPVPICSIGKRAVESAGTQNSPMSPNPTTLRSSGTATPWSRAAVMAPSASSSMVQNNAEHRSGSRSNFTVCAYAAWLLSTTGYTRLGSNLIPATFSARR